MGVRGLQTFIERFVPDAFIPVNIEELSQKYRKETGLEPILVIDFSSCVHHIYRQAGFDYLCGGERMEFALKCYNMFCKFNEMNIRYAAFCDGSLPWTREDICKRRRYNEADSMNEIFDLLANGDISAAETKAQKRFPKFMYRFLLNFLERRGVQIIQTLKEPEVEIRDYIAENDCFALLAQDSDFIIADGIPVYISVQHLDLGTLNSYAYRRTQLAEHLGLDSSYLPLFATLCGTNAMPTFLLQDFHRYLLGDLRYQTHLPAAKIFPELCAWIRRNFCGPVTDTGALAAKVAIAINLPDLASKIALSMEGYIIPTRTVQPLENEPDSAWENILLLAKEKHQFGQWAVQIYAILKTSQTHYPHLLELSTTPNYPCSGILLKPIRRRWYGILLKERPDDEGGLYVTEFIYTGPRCLSPPPTVQAEVPVDHPGLLALWKEDGCSLEEKWRLFCWAVSPDLPVDKIRALPGPLQVPAMALYYLTKEVEPFMEKWEVSAFVVLAVRLMSSLEDDVTTRAKQCCGEDLVAIHLGSVYVTTCNIISSISDCCGFISSMFQLEDYSFFEGKLFHSIYAFMKEGAAGSELCGSGRHNLHNYEALDHFLYPDVSVLLTTYLYGILFSLNHFPMFWSLKKSPRLFANCPIFIMLHYSSLLII